MIEERLKYLQAFISYVMRRYSADRCSSIAAELTVTSLLALVPLTAVIFSLLAFVPSFQSLGQEVQTLMFRYFVPATGETVQTYINEFVAKARGLSGLGFVMLIVTALLLMRTIDASFNKIWQVKSNKSMVRTLLVYWAILTLGPILLGSSVLISSYIQSLPVFTNVAEYSQWMTFWVPFFMAAIAFSVMFFVIPNRRIFVLHAVFSGLVTASLFEVAKALFAIFVSSFSTYQLIFGALATIPLFLIWIYVIWGIVLFGAELCHALESFQFSQSQEEPEHPFLEVVEVLLVLIEHQKLGKTINEDELSLETRKRWEACYIRWLEKLIEFNVVSKGQDQSYCLINNASAIDYKLAYKAANRKLPTLQEVDACELPENIKLQVKQLIKGINQQLSDHLEA
ncbi:YihY family inner membrane protein [Aliikangiella sp. IMCC44653]